MAKGDIPNTNIQAPSSSFTGAPGPGSQNMRSTGNPVPMWQQFANSNQSYPMGMQVRQPPMGPFGPMAPRPGIMGSIMNIPSRFQMSNRGYGPQMPMHMMPQPGMNRGFGAPNTSFGNIPMLLSNMGMSGQGQMQPPPMSMGGSNNDTMQRPAPSY